MGCGRGPAARRDKLGELRLKKFSKTLDKWIRQAYNKGTETERKVSQMTLNEMITLYNELTAAEGYIVGFILNHLLYYVRFDHLPTEILKFDRASSKRGGMAKVRVRLGADIRKALVANGQAVLMGSETMLMTTDKWNKGERFERIITETLTAEKWVKDHTPFNVVGDIELEGKQIQVKFDDAELTNEKTLKRIAA